MKFIIKVELTLMHSMKLRHLVLLGAACCACGDEPTAHAVLAGVRSLFPSPHDASGHRVVLRVDVQPDAPGWRVCEMPCKRYIRGRDSEGRELTGDWGGWEASPHGENGRSVQYTFGLPGRITWLDIKEKLEVQLAEQLHTMRLGAVDMIAPGHYTAEGVVFRIEPDAANAEASNRERDGSLCRARLTIVYPAEVNIMRISRVWHGGRNDEPDTELPPFSQAVEVLHTVTQGAEKRTRIELWVASPTEELEVTTCARSCLVAVPLHFRVMLGDPVQPTDDAP